ncbi:DUF4013 domain-containing protein [Natronolimnobius baerhuensis]|uniref:DUF4013 domain-containing protein n=1 Tax=Natronolimnobius baerhuensis TaxID=253108 RepID=A0A202E4A7_9EURY|nr:DUF4013 domain-containing protein [Natronolimnobius baerhuensis]OVE83034.1 hypothetical protein B2G88_16570 [Natronolimnobius baerhuensis]
MWEALRYPFRGDHAEKALLSAWLCVLVHALILPVLALVPLLGYAIRVLATGEDDTPPPFLERTVLRQSLGGLALTAVYAVVPLVTTIVVISLFVADGEPPAEADAIFFLFGSTATLIVLAIFAYVLPIGLANYGRERTLRAGVTNLTSVAGNAIYFVGWASGTMLFLVGVSISSVLIDAGSVFTVLGSFVGAYAVIVSSRRIGRSYADSQSQ